MTARKEQLEIQAFEMQIAHAERMHALQEKQAAAELEKAEWEARTAKRCFEHVDESLSAGKPPAWGGPKGES